VVYDWGAARETLNVILYDFSAAFGTPIILNYNSGNLKSIDEFQTDAIPYGYILLSVSYSKLDKYLKSWDK
jgi:hypothetical protein